MVWTPQDQSDLNEQEARAVLTALKVTIRGLESHMLEVNLKGNLTQDDFHKYCVSALEKLTTRDDGRKIQT